MLGNREKKFSDSLLKDKTTFLSKQKPFGFQENKGQMADMEGKTVSYVLFKAQAPGLNIWVTTTGLTYQFLKFEEDRSLKNLNNLTTEETAKVGWHRVDMILKNANIKKENVSTEGDMTKGEVNYYLGNCPNGVFNVKTFSKITIKNIYDGIDWVVHTNKDRFLKQDFIVHPNADPNQLKLIYEGSGKFDVTNNQIHFENEFGEVQEGKLFCYQGNSSNEIKSNYIIKKNAITQNISAGNLLPQQLPTNNQQLFSYEIEIKTKGYDKTQPLIIDPQLVWGTFVGGTDSEGPMSVECDATNNIFVTGYSKSINFPLLNPGGGAFYQPTNVGLDEDIFIMKYTNTGVLLWSTYCGGPVVEYGNKINITSTGDIYITGYTSSKTFPIVNLVGAYNQAVNGGLNDAFILRFTNTGALIWATYFGGPLDDKAWSICSDATGNIFFTGYTASLTGFPLMNPGGGAYYDNSNGGGYGDVFIVKMNASGSLVWSTFYGGTAGEQAYAITSDAAGNIYLVGRTGSNDFPVLSSTGYYQGTYAGGTDDAFILKFNNAGVHQWATFYGSTGMESANSIIHDASGNLFIAGNTDSPTFPVQNLANAYNQPGVGGLHDAFILKLDPSQNLLWATPYGGSGNELFYSYNNLALDKCNNIYLTFSTESPNLPMLPSTCGNDFNDNSLSGFSDVAIIKFSNSGQHLWASYFGGDGIDKREPVALDQNNNLFIAYEAGNVLNSASYPIVNPGAGAYYDPSYNSPNSDVFIAKLKPIVPTFTQTQVNATSCSVCDGSATITLTCGNPNYSYVWSNGTQTLNNGNNSNTITNLCPGTYTVKAISDCSDTVTVTFAINGSSASTPINVAVSRCVGSSYTLPSGQTTTFSGVYIDTVTSSSGCDSIIITTLNFVTTIQVSQTVQLCNGNSYTLPDGTHITTAGAYTSTLPTAGGCDSIVTTNVNMAPVSNSTQNPIICTGQNFTLPNGNIANTTGTWIDTLQAANGCDSIITTHLTVSPTITVSQNQSICTGDSYTLPDGTSVNVAGTYTYTTQTNTGCDSTITTVLTVNTAPNATAGHPLALGCSTTQGNISVTSSTPGATYNWSGPGIISGGNTNVALVSTAGTYTVAVTDPVTNCTNTATVIVTNTGAAPLVNVTPLVLACNPNTGVLSANSNISGVIYNWSGPGVQSGANTSSPTVNATGTYTVTVMDLSTGCSATATTVVTSTPFPTAGVSPDVSIAYGASTILTATGGSTYNWTPSSGLLPTTGSNVTASPGRTTLYCVEVTDNNGCKDTACVNVYVELPCPSNDNMGIPNAFSPNNDGINDEFCLQGWDVCIEAFTIIIYDRWGEKVFKSSSPTFCWDGTYKGAKLDPQVLVYNIHASYTSLNTAVVRNGNISLIR